MKYYENNYIPTKLREKYQNPNLVVDNNGNIDTLEEEIKAFRKEQNEEIIQG